MNASERERDYNEMKSPYVGKTLNVTIKLLN